MLKDKSISPHQIIFESAITRIEIDLYRSNLWITYKGKEDSILFYKIPLDGEFIAQKLNVEFNKKNFILNSVHNDFLVISKIIDPGKPEENEFLIIDALSNQIIKSFSGFRFTGFLNDSQFQIEKSGFESIKQEIIDLEEFRNDKKSELVKIYQPQIFLPKNELYDSIIIFLERKLKTKLISPIEMLEHNQNIIISVHSKENDLLRKQLLVINSDGEIIFKHELYTGLKKRMPDSFFVSGNLLIFVSRFNELNIYNIDSDNAN